MRYLDTRKCENAEKETERNIRNEMRSTLEEAKRDQLLEKKKSEELLQNEKKRTEEERSFLIIFSSLNHYKYPSHDFCLI